MRDLVLKEVLVFRGGEWRPTDITVEAGRIVETAEPGLAGAARETRDLKGLYASPGWVDLHAHLLPLRHGGVGTQVKKIGLKTGVTALVDVGTVGAANFHLLRDRVIAGAEVPVKCFLNVKSTGIRFWKVGANERGLYDLAAMERVASAHPEIVRGVKVTASKEHMLDDDPLYYVRAALEAGTRLSLPVMIHIGRPPPSLDQLLPLARPGDIVTHCFRNGDHHILDAAGKVRGEVKAAAARGVRFDIGHGVRSFSFPVAEAALADGLVDFTISSDLYMLSTPYRAKNFANVLTKFLALGMRLEEIMTRASTEPAKLVGLERAIAPGAPAAITLFKLVDAETVVDDCWGVKRRASRRIVPVAVVHDGVYLHAA